jgi:SAM-dependent methyltransferase
VRCPRCKSCFCTLHESDSPSFYCPGCRARYPVYGGIVDLIPDLRFERSLAQASMEWPALVSIYESKLWRRSTWQGLVLGLPFEREAEVIMQAVQPDKASTLLDLACGSGIYTRRLAQAATLGRVVGLDLSVPMLQWAARRDREDGIENVAYLRATALQLPFADACFDRINCSGALHLFPSAAQALGEMQRVLKPGGRLAIGTFRKRRGWLGRLRTRSGRSLGVNAFTPEGMEKRLVRLGVTNVRIHADARWWMIVSGEKG